MLRAYIVDDERLAVERLTRLLEATGRVRIAGSTTDPETAIAELRDRDVDVLFLDIQMPGLTGFDLLEQLDHDVPVVFTTAYDQYALEAFDSHAVGYLLKPVRRERLETALAHAARLGDALLSELGRSTKGFERRRHVAARVRDELRLIPLGEIRLLKAEQKYVSVFHAGGEDLIEDSLRQLEQEFADLFVRIHRSMLVAVGAIETLEKDSDGGYHVRLRGMPDTLPVSRRQVTDLKSRLGVKR
jgi:two-component system response regulator AlgR